MGVSQVGVDTIPPQTVVIKKVNVAASPSSTASSMLASGTFVPKGAYSVRVVTEGGVTNNSLGAINVQNLDDLNATITTVDAETGRIGPTYVQSGLLRDSLILGKDSFVYVTISSTVTSISVTLELIPKKTDAIALPTFTGNATTTATTTSTSGSINDIGFGGFIPGWDYDNDSPCVVVITSAMNNPTINQVRYFTSATIYRFIKSTGKWTSKRFTGISPASGHTFVNSLNGLYINGNTATPESFQFFIKGNYLHNLVYQGVLSRTSDESRWGWIKGDISVAGTTLSMEAGHANIAFADLTANMDTTATANNRMIYYWDRVSHKVIYNGCADITTNGTWGAKGWRHKWGQWDIATDVIDYQLSNGVLDPRTAGANGTNNLAWRMACPNAAEGKSFAIVDNSGTNYSVHWNRNGTYTGIGDYTVKVPFQSTNGSANLFTTYNSGDFTKYGYMVMDSNNNGKTADHTITSGNPIAFYDVDGFNSKPTGTFRGGRYANYTTGDGPYSAYLVTNEWIVFVYGGYQKMTGNAGIRFTFPLTVYMMPLNEISIIRMIQPAGGLPSTRLGTPNSGINSGTW